AAHKRGCVTGKRDEETRTARKSSSPDLAVADANPFVGRQLLEAHGTASADLVSADADLRPHAEFGAVGEPGRGVPVNGGGIDFGQEGFRRSEEHTSELQSRVDLVCR